MLSFHVEFEQTDRQMDRRTTVKQYAPTFRYAGIKICGMIFDLHYSVYFV